MQLTPLSTHWAPRKKKRKKKGTIFFGHGVFSSIYLASGCSFHDLHFSYGIGISTASTIVREVFLSIWSINRPECIPKPTKEQWELTALEFERTTNFPHCLGAVDGKHIRVIKPEHSGSMFYNYKDFFP